MKDKKVTTLILVLVLVISIIASGTFAYWQWITSTAQETLVNVSLTDDATIYIDFPSEEITHMYPTSDCEANGTSSWVTEITVNNGTGVLMATNFKLKVKIEDKNGNVITNSSNEWNANPFRYYIKYAVTEENESCRNALITGRFDENVLTYGNVASSDPKYSQRNDWYDSKSITKDGTDGFPLVSSRIGSGVAFHAHPNTSTSHTYKVWVWLDEEYKSVTVGNDSTMDKMQDAKVTVSWSENSELEQVKQTQTPVGEAVAIYSEDDNSLRFYRDNNPASISVGSTYNGRTVTAKYTGFENTTNVAWNELQGFGSGTQDVEIIVFEDYIYPIDTASWFWAMNYCEFIDVTKLNTSKVTNMSYMFSESSFIENIVGLENWDVSNVTNMEYMFFDVGLHSDSPMNLSLENWDTSNVVNMSNMFEGYGGIQLLDLSGWNVCNVTDYEDFSGNSVIQPNFGHPRLCQGDVKGDAYAVFSETDNSLRFYRSEDSITEGSVYRGKRVSKVFTGIETGTYSSTSVPWTDVSNNGYMHETLGWMTIQINEVVFEDNVYPVSTAYWFSELSDCNLFDVTKLDTSNVTDMSMMFQPNNTQSLSIVGLENWNTSNVTNMYGTFSSVNDDLDLRKWDVSKVTDMSGMFGSASGNVNVSGWDTSNVTNMMAMFNSFSGNVIGVEDFNTSKVTSMRWMFSGVSSSLSLDLSRWNVCNVTDHESFTSNSNIIEPNWGMSC